MAAKTIQGKCIHTLFTRINQLIADGWVVDSLFDKRFLWFWREYFCVLEKPLVLDVDIGLVRKKAN